MITNKISLISSHNYKFSKNYNKTHEKEYINHASTWGTYKFSKQNDSKTHKKNTIFHRFTRETYKFSKNFGKIHEKVYKKVKIFHNMTYET